MKRLSSLALVVNLLCPSTAVAQVKKLPEPPPDCNAEGTTRYICSGSAAEDLVLVPGTPFVLVTSYRGKGGLRQIDVRDGKVSTLFPAPGVEERLDRKRYPNCPGPLAAPDKIEFSTHGLFFAEGKRGPSRLLVVHHGTRESIEAFDVTSHADRLTLRWVGCVVAPNPIGLNSVVALKDGGFITSNFLERGAGTKASLAKAEAGAVNGELWEWHPNGGWKTVPGSRASGANGIALSPDERTVYYSGWGSKTVIRLSRGDQTPKRDSVALDFRPDNMRWMPDGGLIIAGQGNDLTKVIRVEPSSLAVTPLLSVADTDKFSFGTGAIQVGRDIWVGSARSYQIGIFPMPK